MTRSKRSKEKPRKHYSVFIGVDPGVHGATAVLDNAGNLLIVDHFEISGSDYRRHLLKYRKDSAVMIEKVGAAPKRKQGTKSAVTFGHERGKVTWAFDIMGYNKDDITLVAPSKWMGVLRALTKGRKEVTLIRARTLYPAYADEITIDNADAVMIAHYCRLQLAPGSE